jgi:hypothetical protein
MCQDLAVQQQKACFFCVLARAIQSPLLLGRLLTVALLSLPLVIRMDCPAGSFWLNMLAHVGVFWGCLLLFLGVIPVDGVTGHRWTIPVQLCFLMFLLYRENVFI